TEYDAASIFGGTTNFVNTNVDAAKNGLSVLGDAHVTFRGSFSNILERAIKACNWDQECVVDATHLDWGSADGPFVTSGTDLVCGSVAVSPWVFNSTNYDESTFAVKNCDSSPTPAAELSTAVSYFQERISLKQIDCNNGFQDACQAIQTAMTCIGAARNLAEGQLPWPMPPATTAEEVGAMGELMLEAGSGYLTVNAPSAVSGLNVGFILDVYDTVHTILDIRDAYNSCAP
ncbi:MAG: hypothetical protein ACRD4B_07425, partial [Acidobacteriota bacterium]